MVPDILTFLTFGEGAEEGGGPRLGLTQRLQPLGLDQSATQLCHCRRETEEDDLTCACRAPSAARRPAAPPWRAARRGAGRRCRGRGGCRGWGRAAAARGPGPCLQHSAR